MTLGFRGSMMTRGTGKKVINVVVIFCVFTVSAIAALLMSCDFYKIPMSSMSPTLQKGDHIIINRAIYSFFKPSRGDLIIFDNPLNPRQIFVKRVIGLPGERLKILNGKVYVNSRVLTTFEIRRNIIYANRENWKYGGSNQEIAIPPDAYFVMGDNSLESADSRLWGPISKESIRGKVYFIYWPIDIGR